MSYPDLEVMLNESPLSRRVMNFFCNGCLVWLYHDEIHSRATTRHKWRTKSAWSRYSSRSQHQPAPVPKQVVDEIMNRVRNSIEFVPYQAKKKGGA